MQLGEQNKVPIENMSWASLVERSNLADMILHEHGPYSVSNTKYRAVICSVCCMMWNLHVEMHAVMQLSSVVYYMHAS